ncbi:MAG: hypothetical protein AB7S75_07205 [Desulfococcaceae bacterium]
MTNIRWHIIPLICVILSSLLVWAAAFAASSDLGGLQWLLYLSGILSLSALFLFRRKIGAAEHELEQQKEELEQEKQAFGQEKENFEKIRKVFEQEGEKRLLLIQKKEAAISQKLMIFHEWMEFPSGIEDRSEDSEIHKGDFTKQDQAVLELLKERTDRLFEKIKNNKYQDAGNFKRELLMNDVSDLIISVARIYHPESQNPLLETSVEQLLRSANRIALQVLVLLEQLPLDIKTYNLKKIYETVQAGVKAYGVYKSIDPYWTYFRPVYYLGRFALGSNPVTLGVTWALGELAKGGSKKISSWLANRYALKLLYEVVFIIGNEAAAIFGGNFRHREVNWIYGAELTELIRGFPLSAEALGTGLNEIGQLRLRNEYDRIFFYRCLAARKSASPDSFPARNFLSAGDCQIIARRLERFSEKFVRAKADELEKWKKKAEERLGCRMLLESKKSADRPSAEKAGDALRSLAGFIMEVKAPHPDELPVILSQTRMITLLDEENRRNTVVELSQEPPMIFDYPDIEPSDGLLSDYFRDLREIGVRVFPYAVRGENMIEEAGHYFRLPDLKSMKKEMDKMSADFLAEKLMPESPEKKPSPRMALGLLSCLDAEEIPCFLYKNIRIIFSGPREIQPMLKNRELWMMGTSRRLILSAIPEKDEAGAETLLLWEAYREGDFRVQAERMENRVSDDCRVSGGKWLCGETDPLSSPHIILSGSAMSRYKNYFSPLENFCGEAV